jgi:hypothetical protein
MDDLILRCRATKADGHLCMVIVSPTEVRCGTHRRSYGSKTPRQFVLREVQYRYRRMLDSWRGLFMNNLPDYFELQTRIMRWYHIARATFQNMTDDQIHNLLGQRGAWYIRGHLEPINAFGDIVIPPPPAPPVRPPPGRELEDFAGDKQNVHRKATVHQTIEIVKRVLKIPVPSEYQWNTETLSKTPGEIIVACKLTPQAGMIMIDKYTHDDDVYDLGKGIYGKVLDSVWQYISKSDDRESMCVILKQELQDNIGMCAQGNLSRLCNALAGYMEGIEDIESPAEKLGRLIPPLMEIENEADRIEQAKKILADVNLPTNEWDNWLSVLKD